MESIQAKRTGRWKSILSPLILVGIIGASDAAAQRRPYRAIDVVRDIRDDHKGIPSLAAAVKTADNYARTLSLSPSAYKSYQFASYVVQHVDFDFIFNSSFAKVLPDETRAFALMGTARPQGYTLEYRKATTDELKPEGFLGFAWDLRIREDKNPIPDEDKGFAVSNSLKVNLGEINHRYGLRAIGALLRVGDPGNMDILPAGPSWDARANAEWHTTLPNSTAFFEKYATPVPGLSSVPAKEGAYTQVRSRITLKLDQLIADYKDLGSYIERIANNVEIQAKVRYELPNSLRLGEMTLNSAKREATLQLKTQGGRVIPYDKDDKPHFEAAIAFESLPNFSHRIVADAEAKVMGLHIVVPDILVGVTYRDGAIATLENKLLRIGSPKVYGAALGLVPTWAVDAFIPGNIEGYAKKFVDGLLKGSRGTGSALSLAVDTKDPNANVLTAHASTELIDNFFINFGLRMAQRFVWPEEAVVSSAWKLVQQGTGLLAKDMERLRAQNPG